MSRPLPRAAVVVSGVVVWMVCAFVIDWLVLRIYPLPPGLWGHASMREILKTRPDAAVALNVVGDMLVLGVVSLVASRRSRGPGVSAGALITGVIAVLLIVNGLTTGNLRWFQVAGLPLFVFIGLAGARRGAAAA